MAENLSAIIDITESPPQQESSPTEHYCYQMPKDAEITSEAPISLMQHVPIMWFKRIANLKEIKPGDHLAWRRSVCIYHHMIVVNKVEDRGSIILDEDTDSIILDVVQFSPSNNKRVEIHEDTIAIKVGCYPPCRVCCCQCYGELYLVVYRCYTFTADETVARALDKVAVCKPCEGGNCCSASFCGDYRPCSNNCEHTAMQCKIGLSESSQVHASRNVCFELSRVGIFRLVIFMLMDILIIHLEGEEVSGQSWSLCAVPEQCVMIAMCIGGWILVAVMFNVCLNCQAHKCCAPKRGSNRCATCCCLHGKDLCKVVITEASYIGMLIADYFFTRWVDPHRFHSMAASIFITVPISVVGLFAAFGLAYFLSRIGECCFTCGCCCCGCGGFEYRFVFHENVKKKSNTAKGAPADAAGAASADAPRSSQSSSATKAHASIMSKKKNYFSTDTSQNLLKNIEDGESIV